MSHPALHAHSLSPALLDQARALRGVAWFAGAVGLAASFLLMLIPATRALIFPAYLVAFVFWYGIALGGVSLTMLHHLTGGRWGLLVRRPLEAAGLVTIPLALLFLPILLGLDSLYPWAHPAAAQNPLIAHKQSWLNPGAFTLRSALYFAIWIGTALLLQRGSIRQDATEDRSTSRWLARLSGPGLGLVFASASFAAIDWMMSLEPDWYSSIYAAMLITGWGLATFATITLVAATLRSEPALQAVARPRVFQDLGNLMLAFVMLWAYTSFMQYLIIWSGNLTEEIPWYFRRSRGGWQIFVAALILFHFFAPFLLLLIRDLKRRADWLLRLAIFILAMHLVDTIWLILPAQVSDPLSPRIGPPILQLLLVLVALVGIGGVCVASFLNTLAKHPLVPLNDPATDALLHIDEHEAHKDEPMTRTGHVH